MPDSKISALTAITGANIATDDEVAIVDTSAITTKKATVAEFFTKRVIAGTPAAAGELGRDATQLAPNWYDNGQLGTIPKVIAAGVGTQTLTNSVTTDQDFTSIYTLPANSLFTNKIYKVTVMIETVTGTSTATLGFYLKLGATKVVTTSANDITNSTTRSAIFTYYIFGRAAPGAAANVSSSFIIGGMFIGGSTNVTNQPVALATNGALNITLGIVYSATGSTDTVELQGWLVEELN